MDILAKPPRQESMIDGATVFVVEDDIALQEAIVDTLELAGCQVEVASSAEQALQMLPELNVDMIISDVNMGSMDGHTLLAEVKKAKPYLPVLLMTAFGTIQRSVSALKNGAVDYIVKPFEPGVLIDLVKRYALGRLVEVSKPIAEADVSKTLFQLAERVAKTDSTVLVGGDSGTGKEVLARFIHASSKRCDEPFIAINCAAIPESMLEATLFGHEKGAFTGAHQSSPGKFEQANGGTLLLDEISEMDLSLQAKLLRVIQEKEVERVGGRKTINLDVRIIATTNRDLHDYVQQGKFREDLFYRLSVFPLTLTPLKQRIADILPIAKYFLAMHGEKMQRTHTEFSLSAERALQAYDWPGNVRELENVVQRALILQPGSLLNESDLLFDMSSHTAIETPKTIASSSLPVNEKSNENNIADAGVLEADLKRHEYQIILDVLSAKNGSRQLTASHLGVSPRTLRYKMAKMRELGMIE